MFTTLLTAALFIAPAIQGALAEFSVNSPALVQCKEAKISWEATEGPYNVIIVPSSAPCGDVYADAGDHDATFINWKATVPAGMKVQVSIEDKSGDEAWSGIITVGESDDSSCVSSEFLAFATTESASSIVSSSVVPTAVPTSTVVEVATSAAATSSVPIQAVGAVGQGILGDSDTDEKNEAVATKSSIMLVGALVALTAFVL